jgi:hypothetical protein
MKLYQGTRWWLVCPCLVLIVVGCVLATMKRSYTIEESRKIFHYLTVMRASEQEVIDFFDHHSKVVTNPNTSLPERRYYFSRHSLWEAEVQETSAIYNEERKLQSYMCCTQTLNGLALWKYRIGLMKLFGH